MTRTKVRHSPAQRQRRRQRTRIQELTLEQQQAQGNLALIGGPAFIIGLWGITAFTSGLLTAIGTLI